MEAARRNRTPTVMRDAALAAAICAAFGLAVNALRGSGLPLVARTEYQIHVPCPDAKGEVATLAPDDARLRASGTLVVDAREAGEYALWHAEGARSLPYDYVVPVSKKQVEQLASSGARLVVVYGDGQDPDSGRELAKELASKGIRNVHYVGGGAPALNAAGARP